MNMRVWLALAIVSVATARPQGPAWKGIKVASGDKLVMYDVSPYTNHTDHSMYTTKDHIMARSGDLFGSVTFGECINKFEKSTGAISHNPDFTSILTAYNKKLYSITHFQSPQPATVYFSKLEQDDKGMLSIKTTALLDFSKDGRLWARTWARRSTSLTPVQSLPLKRMISLMTRSFTCPTTAALPPSPRRRWQLATIPTTMAMLGSARLTPPAIPSAKSTTLWVVRAGNSPT